MTYYILGLAILKMTSWLALRARAYMLSCDAWGVLTGLLNRVSHVTVGRSRLPWSGVPIACPRCTCSCGLAHSIGAWQLLVGATRLLELFIQRIGLSISGDNLSGRHQGFRKTKCCI